MSQHGNADMVIAKSKELNLSINELRMFDSYLVGWLVSCVNVDELNRAMRYATENIMEHRRNENLKKSTQTR